MRSVMHHDFARTPQVKMPRSLFNLSKGHKTTFNASYLIPVYSEEVYPGDSFKLSGTVIARLQTLKYPIMDNIYLDMFYFFVPRRLLWEHWEQFNGARDTLSQILTPTEYTVPVLGTDDTPDTVATAVLSGSLSDYLGLPLTDQDGMQAGIRGDVIHYIDAAYHRAYYKIWNEFFRDQNLQEKLTEDMSDGPDITAYALQRRNKRRDYFTQALPWPQKGEAIEMPLGTTAPVIGNGYTLGFTDGTQNWALGTPDVTANRQYPYADGWGDLVGTGPVSGNVNGSNKYVGITTDKTKSGLVADLSDATAATINSIRQAFQLQRLLERDARGGTRYIEMIYAHFGVTNPDFRLQRPEFLGSGSMRINVHPVQQTSESATTPQGTLAAYGVGAGNVGGFFKSFTEHGVILGIANVRADLTYQQGIERRFSRRTRYDFYLPVLAGLGEQYVYNQEIFASGSNNGTQNPVDIAAWGYVPRWDELRSGRSIVSGLFHSELTAPLDAWHLSAEFASLPGLNTSFIQDSAYEVIQRVVAVQNTHQIIFDSYFDVKAARCLPAYGVPGLIDHF